MQVTASGFELEKNDNAWLKMRTVLLIPVVKQDKTITKAN